MPNLGGNAPYYGGGQVPNPANVTQIYESSPTFQAPLGSVAVNSSTENAYMAVAESGSGNRTVWKEISGGTGINAVDGTANQIHATTVSGVTTLSLTNGVAIGSYQPQAPPVGGLTVPGASAFGTSFPSSSSLLQVNNTGVFPFSLFLSGTNMLAAVAAGNVCYNAFDNTTLSPAAGANIMASFASVTSFNLPGGQTSGISSCFYGAPFVNSNSGTLTLAAVYYAGRFGGPLSGTLTNAYGGYFADPGQGTNRCAVYADDLCVGVAPVGTPTLGTIQTAPPSSETATAAFGTITFGTPVRNALGYDVLVSGTIAISAATAGVIAMGVGSTILPTTNPLTQALTTSSELYIGFSAYVPAGYSLVFLNTAGSSTVGSIVSVVTPV